MMQSSLVCR